MRAGMYDSIMLTEMKKKEMKPSGQPGGFSFGVNMPYKPDHPCSHPGCNALIPAGQMYCEKHKKLHPQEVRSASSRGYTSRWRKASKQFLAAHPLCEECLRHGRYTKSEVVDHIVPHRGSFQLFWDRRNWQALCKSCHDKKTAKEERYPVYHY